MPSATTLIQRQTVSGSSTTSVSFTSIPQTYQDLRLVTSHRISSTTGGDYLAIRFNSDTSSSYLTFRWFGANSVGTLSNNYGHIGNTGGGTQVNSSAFGISEADILSYSVSGVNKSWLYENGMTDNDTDIAYFMGVGSWTNTSAITRIDILAGTTGGNFTAGSTFSLWGTRI